MCKRSVLAFLSAVLAITFPITAAAQAPAATPSGSPAAQAAGDAAGTSDKAVALRLADHTMLVGTIVSEDASTIVLDAGVLGKITLKASDVVGRMDPAVLAAVGAPPPAPPPMPDTGVSFFAPAGQVRWTRTMMFGGSYSSPIFEQGAVRTNMPEVQLTGESLKLPGTQYTVQGQLSIIRSSDAHMAYFNASYIRMIVEPLGKQTEVPKISVGYSFRNSQQDRYFYTSLFEWYTDKVRNIEVSNQAFVGVGFHAVRTPKVKLDLVPLVGVLHEEKGTRFDNKLLGGFGGMWQLTYSPSPVVQIEHRENFHAAFNDFEYRGLESYLGFKGMIGKRLALSVGVTHTFDASLGEAVLTTPTAPGLRVFANKEHVLRATTGIQVTF
jgi:hypothetical protein